MNTLVEAEPSVTRFREGLSLDHAKIASILNDMGRHVESIAAYNESLVIEQSLADARPSSLELADSMAKTHNNLAGPPVVWANATRRFS